MKWQCFQCNWPVHRQRPTPVYLVRNWPTKALVKLWPLHSLSGQQLWGPLDPVNSPPMSLDPGSSDLFSVPSLQGAPRGWKKIVLLSGGIHRGMMVSAPSAAESRLYHRHKEERWPLNKAKLYIRLLSWTPWKSVFFNICTDRFTKNFHFFLHGQHANVI